MSDYSLIPRLASGAPGPKHATIGAITLEERPGLVLASVAARKGRKADVEAAMRPLLGAALPGPSQSTLTAPVEAAWTGPDQWFLAGWEKDQTDLAGAVKNAIGDAGSVTDQSDAWVAIDVRGGSLLPLFQGLVNLDLASKSEGYFSRTVIEHIGLYLQIREPWTLARLLAPRSFATNCFQILDSAAKSLAARHAISQE